MAIDSGLGVGSNVRRSAVGLSDLCRTVNPKSRSILGGYFWLTRNDGMDPYNLE